MNANHLLQSAHGNWPAILLAAGVPDRFLTGKHGPCPFCGGKDRYRFTDYQQRGGFICSRCNPDGGDGLALLMQWRGDDFKQALQWLADYLRLPSEALAVTRQTLAILRNELSQADIDKRLFKLGKLWSRSAALAGDCIGSRYLKHRGVLDESSMPDPQALRFITALPYYTGTTKQSDFPALLAAVTTPDGRNICIHRTYLNHDSSGKADVPEAKKLMPPAGSITGAAIRLFPAGTLLGVAEGIETALGAALLHGVPVWACISAHGLQSVVLPDSVDHLLIFADQDAAGMKAARNLRDRYHKLQSEIVTTGQAGKDWADIAKEAKQ